MSLLAHGRAAGPKNMQRCRGLNNIINVKGKSLYLHVLNPEKYLLSGDHGALTKTDHREILNKSPKGSNETRN